MRSLFLAGAVLAGLAATASAQETIAPGFAIVDSRPPAVGGFPAWDTLSDGSRVYFDGDTVDLYDATGAFEQTLYTAPSFVFASFVEVDPSETFAVVGESSNGDLLKTYLDGSGTSTLANLSFNYDAAFDSSDSILVSAAAGGSGNDVVRVDTDSGALTFVANVPGFSGPLDVAPNGDLVYGELGGGPNARIYRWTAAQLSGGPLLTDLDATLMNDTLVGATSLVVDPVFGNVFVSESDFSSVGRIVELDADGTIVDVPVDGDETYSNLELLQGPGVGHFHRYQPADGLNLSYGKSGAIVRVAPQRPELTLTQSGSFATLTLTGAEPNSGALILFGPQANVVPEYSQQLAFDFLFHTDLTFGKIRRLGLRIPTDANGEASFSYFDPGGSSIGNRWFQTLITDANGMFIGSSNSVVN